MFSSSGLPGGRRRCIVDLGLGWSLLSITTIHPSYDEEFNIIKSTFYS